MHRSDLYLTIYCVILKNQLLKSHVTGIEMHGWRSVDVWVERQTKNMVACGCGYSLFGIKVRSDRGQKHETSAVQVQNNGNNQTGLESAQPKTRLVLVRDEFSLFVFLFSFCFVSLCFALRLTAALVPILVPIWVYAIQLLTQWSPLNTKLFRVNCI